MYSIIILCSGLKDANPATKKNDRIVKLLLHCKGTHVYKKALLSNGSASNGTHALLPIIISAWLGEGGDK